jgi:hypothetical protein
MSHKSGLLPNRYTLSLEMQNTGFTEENKVTKRSAERFTRGFFGFSRSKSDDYNEPGLRTDKP